MSTVAWSAQQRCLAAALLDPHAPAPDFLRTRADAALADRFDVYRNNVHSSLIDALLAAFPVTAQLVSEASLRALARDFLRTHLPQQAALQEYGAALPAFIRGYAPAASLPWLADIAALEHVWWQSFGAADAAALAPAALAALTTENLTAWHARLHPAVRLVQSTHPVHDIWVAHQAGGAPQPPRRWEAQCALLTRPQADVEVRRITTAQHLFFVTLATGATLEQSGSAALARDPHFDFGITLLLAIEAGAIEELHP